MRNREDEVYRKSLCYLFLRASFNKPNLAMVYCVSSANIINMEPNEASKFSDGFYRPTDWTKTRFFKSSLHISFYPGYCRDGRLYSDKSHIHLKSNNLLC